LAKNLWVKNVVFGQATKNGPSYATLPHDGILGLALRGGCKIDKLPVLETAAQQKLFDENVFTIHYRRPTGPFDKKLGGSITFGGRDTTNCERPSAEISVIGRGHWKFMIDSYEVGDMHAGAKKWYAVSDSGTSFISAPQRVVTAIRRELRKEGW
ncbi:aspartic protease 2B, partial [Aphelenchoides avenae]